MTRGWRHQSLQRLLFVSLGPEFQHHCCTQHFAHLGCLKIKRLTHKNAFLEASQSMTLRRFLRFSAKSSNFARTSMPSLTFRLASSDVVPCTVVGTPSNPGQSKVSSIVFFCPEFHKPQADPRWAHGRGRLLMLPALPSLTAC